MVDAFISDDVPIEYADIESIKPDVLGGVKIVFKDGARKIIPHPESEDFLEWFNAQNEERSEAMNDKQIEKAIDAIAETSQLTEDFGDVPVYLNVYDIFDTRAVKNPTQFHDRLKEILTASAHGPELETFLAAIRAKLETDLQLKDYMDEHGIQFKK